MFSNENSGGISIWGLVIFFLILFWMCGNGIGGGFGACNRGLAFAAAAENGQTDRDVLNLTTYITKQNADTQNMLQNLAFQQEKQGLEIYIKQLERAATQQFIQAQTDTLSNKMDNLAAAGALQRQADVNNLQSQINAIGCQMLKAPAPVPFVGLPTVGCTNYNLPGCNSCFNV